jgi:protein-S-isoprenylcysteine O-methyltransferase Ste14
MEAPRLNVWIRSLAAAAIVGGAGRWNGPTVIVLACAAGCSVFDLGRREEVERTEPAHDDDALSAVEPYGIAMQLAFVAVLGVGAWDNRAPEVAWRSPGLLGVLGFGIIMLGVALRQSAARALGDRFTVGVSVPVDHELVVTGPYRWIRHPNYAGLLLVAFGTATMVWSPLAAETALVAWLPLALLRIHKEERALHARLGDAFSDYARASWCLVPGVY